MHDSGGPSIQLDEQKVDPIKVLAVTHELMGHPLLKLEQLVTLWRRLAARNSVRWHGYMPTNARIGC